MFQIDNIFQPDLWLRKGMWLNMEEATQKILWGMLIENQLYKLLEFAKSESEREQLIKNFSVENGIPIEFIKDKIARINQVMKQKKGDDYLER